MTATALSEDVRLIAFYLPQFHPIPENDRWWGKGFTEWTNVSRARPVFEGHYQPHYPSELGFYDLRVPEVREQQAQLAREHGVHGFCYYYFWFAGKRLLERPFEEVLATGQPNFPFCLCWANESWTRRWDGAEHDVLMAQVHSAEHDAKFIRSVVPAFRDPRYIRIQGRPLLIIYRASLLPDPASTIAVWAHECRVAGLPPPFVLAALTFEVRDPRPYGCDGAVEFPPHHTRARHLTPGLRHVNPQYRGYVFDYADAARLYLERPEPEYPLFHTVMTGWDNTPRRQFHSNVFLGSTPARYREWLARTIQRTGERHPPGSRLVFINAWNEWGEGAHLEPDQRHGRAYLEATLEALTKPVASDVTADSLASPSAEVLNAETSTLQRIDELLGQEEFEVRRHATGLAGAPGREESGQRLADIQTIRATVVRILGEEMERALHDEPNRAPASPNVGPVALALIDRVSRGLDRIPPLKRALRAAFRRILRA